MDILTKSTWEMLVNPVENVWKRGCGCVFKKFNFF
jgi:hypothetical protein